MNAMTLHPLAERALSGGLRVYYHAGQTNHCPGCGGTHWTVGRATAECANCATALPLAEGAVR